MVHICSRGAPGEVFLPLFSSHLSVVCSYTTSTPTATCTAHIPYTYLRCQRPPYLPGSSVL